MIEALTTDGANSTIAMSAVTTMNRNTSIPDRHRAIPDLMFRKVVAATTSVVQRSGIRILHSVPRNNSLLRPVGPPHLTSPQLDLSHLLTR